MVQKIRQADPFGRLGESIGKGIEEQVPREIERRRLASGLKELGDQKGLTPFQQFAGLASLPGSTPHIVEHGTNLLRQQQILDSVARQNPGAQPQQQPQPVNQTNFINEPPPEKRSVTSPEGVQAKLNPYIPPSGEEAEYEARQLMAKEPLIYPNLESARAAVNAKINANVNKSNAEINAEDLKQGVQSTGEQELSKEIDTLGAKIPGSHLSSLKQDMLDELRSGKITEREAAVKYGKQADALSKDYADINAWGGPALIMSSPKNLLSSMKAKQKTFKALGKEREYADALIASNGVSPEFGYARALPVSEEPKLNSVLKSLPSLKAVREKVPGLPGLAGVGMSGVSREKKMQETSKVLPELAKAMGKNGSPLSVAYELEKKGYDPQLWKDYLIDNQERLDLTVGQIGELGKTSNNYYGWLNDWWLSAFSGIE